MGPASIGGVPGCLRPARPPLIQIDIAGVHRSRSPSCSGRGSGCPGSGVGQRDESTSPARPSRQVGRALPDGTSAVSAPAARILAAWLSVAPVSNRCTGHRLETCATLWLRPTAGNGQWPAYGGTVPPADLRGFERPTRRSAATLC